MRQGVKNQREKAPGPNPREKWRQVIVFTLLLAGEALAQSRHSVSAAEWHSDGPLLFLPGTSFKVQSRLSTLSQFSCCKMGGAFVPLHPSQQRGHAGWVPACPTVTPLLSEEQSGDRLGSLGK